MTIAVVNAVWGFAVHGAIAVRWFHPMAGSCTYRDRGGGGGSDLYIAHRNGESWADPINSGCTIISPFVEYAAAMIPGKRSIVFPSTYPFKGSKKHVAVLWFA